MDRHGKTHLAGVVEVEVVGVEMRVVVVLVAVFMVVLDVLIEVGMVVAVDLEVVVDLGVVDTGGSPDTPTPAKKLGVRPRLVGCNNRVV